MELAFWKQIASNNFTVPDEHSLDELTDELLGYIGSSTPQLRLDIAYNTLQQWIVTKPQYQPDQLRTMRDKMLGNIFVAIGDQDTDTVFLRSFSMWILGFIIAHDNDAPFLDKTEWLTLLDKVEHYTLTEQDLRGWVEGKAWAHSCAHVASVLCLLAKSRYADAAIHERILMLTAAKMTLQVDHVYSHGEDDRMATVVTAVVEHGLLGMGVFRHWLVKLESVMELAQQGMPFDIKIFNAYMNTRNFLRCVYFPLELCIPNKPPVWNELQPELLEAIKEVGLC